MLQPHVPGRMTLDEFLVWDAPGPERWQLIDGEPVAMAPTSEPHGALLGEIARAIGNCLVETNSKCRVIVAPGIVPRVMANMNFRIPDIGITCAPPGDKQMVPDPVVMIEVLSPSNERNTRANVWAYATIPSVREILLFRSSRIEAELLRRDEDGTWPEKPQRLLPGSSVALQSIGFSAPLDELYRTTGLPIVP